MMGGEPSDNNVLLMLDDGGEPSDNNVLLMLYDGGGTI